MLPLFRRLRLAAYALSVLCLCSIVGLGQSGGNSTSVVGTVLDPSGAVVANATVEVHNPVSGFDRSATTDSSGHFSIANIPFNPYHLSVTGKGFAPYAQDIDVRSVVPVALNINLELAGATTTVEVEGGAADLLETVPTFHTDVDRGLFDKIPLESASSWAIMLKIHSRWMGNPSPTSRAKYFPTKFRSIQSSQWK